MCVDGSSTRLGRGTRRAVRLMPSLSNQQRAPRPIAAQARTCLELRLLPTTREHALPQPQRPAQPALVRAECGEMKSSQPRCRSGSPPTEPSGPGAKLGHLDHIQQVSAPSWTQGANGAHYRSPWPLWPRTCSCAGSAPMPYAAGMISPPW
jgi:hypothetical protein